jgi:hypothetical protein
LRSGVARAPARPLDGIALFALAPWMTETDFLSLLNGVGFPQRYWEMCDRFPVRPIGQANVGRKEDILAAFAEVGVEPRYDSRDRSFEFEKEQIGDFAWSGVFAKQRSGVELMIGGESKFATLGSNFAVLAYQAQRLADPTFVRDPFKGAAPYPRPGHNGDPAALREIVKQHVLLVRLIKDALRGPRAAG